MPAPRFSPEATPPPAQDDVIPMAAVPARRGNAYQQSAYEPDTNIQDFHRPARPSYVRAGQAATAAVHAEAAATTQVSADTTAVPTETSIPEAPAQTFEETQPVADIFQERARQMGIAMTPEQAKRAAEIATGKRVVDPDALPYRQRLAFLNRSAANTTGAARSEEPPRQPDAEPIVPKGTPADQEPQDIPPERAADNTVADVPKPVAGAGGSGNVPPTDKPPVDFAEPPQEDKGPHSEPVPENQPAQSGPGDISDEAQALQGEAAGLGVQFSPADAERVLATIRPADAESTHTERGDKLAAAAAVWGVHMDHADIEQATATLYVEGAGPLPRSQDANRVPSVPLLYDVETRPDTLPREPYVLPEGGAADLAPMYQVALDRLRGNSPDVPSDIAAAQNAVVTAATHKLGDLLGSQVTDLLPESASLLRTLAPFVVDSAVSDHGLVLKARELGVAADTVEIRLRLLTLLGDNLPADVEYIKPDLPYVTEGLSVGTRLEEYRRFTGQPIEAVAQAAGLSVRALERAFTGERLRPDTIQRAMQGLGVPEEVAIPLLQLYQWESVNR